MRPLFTADAIPHSLQLASNADDDRGMQKLCIFVFMIIFSYIGWYLGSLIGGFMSAFFVSGALSLIGVWAGWKVHLRYLD